MNIRLEHITKEFKAISIPRSKGDTGESRQKNVVAVKDLSLEIAEGELVCLLGPSGCGKSTTLSMVAGLERPTSGEIYFGDTPMTGIEAEGRDIGMVFQNYALYPHMTVRENIMFPLKMRRASRDERNERVEAMASMLQLKELLRRKPGQLSGGQQQRVAIARALVKQPQILLLDEPFSNLDARLRIELREDIRALQKRLGITTIFVTHDQEEAMSISDRILLLNAGVLQQYATPQEMYRHPANRFTAGFLGNPPINFLPCWYENGRVKVLDVPDWTLPSDLIQPSSQNIRGEALLGIRPEDLVVQAPGCCPARVAAMQPLGKEVYLKLEAGPYTLTACLSWDHDYQVGDLLPLSVKRLHLFPLEEAEGGGAGEA